MSFDANETGIATGKPIRLYLFERGLLKWRYCTADRDVVYDSGTWVHVALSDDGIRQTGEASADRVKLVGPADLPVAMQFRVAAPTSEMAVTIIDFHYGDTLGRVRFIGSITDVSWPEQDRCEITLASISESMDQTGLRLTWQRGCPHTVYDMQCLAEKTSKKLLTTLTAVTATTIESAALAAQADGYWSGGYIEWDSGSGVLERRGLNQHTGASVQVMGLTYGLAVGLAVAFFPGCDGTIATCDQKFSNKENFGGIPHLSGKSPFSGDPIF